MSQKKVWVPELGEKDIVLVNISEGQLATIITRNNIVIALEDKKLLKSCRKLWRVDPTVTSVLNIMIQLTSKKSAYLRIKVRTDRSFPLLKINVNHLVKL